MSLHAERAYRRQCTHVSLEGQEGSAVHDAAEASSCALKAQQGKGGNKRAESEEI